MNDQLIQNPIQCIVNAFTVYTIIWLLFWTLGWNQHSVDWCDTTGDTTGDTTCIETSPLVGPLLTAFSAARRRSQALSAVRRPVVVRSATRAPLKLTVGHSVGNSGPLFDTHSQHWSDDTPTDRPIVWL